MLTVALVIVLCGCSLEMTQLPNNYDRRTIPRCDTDSIYPIGDAAAAVLLGAGAVVVGVAGHDAADGSSKWGAVIVMGLGSLIFAGVSHAGFGWDNRCTEAKQQWDQRQIEQDTLVQEAKAKTRKREPQREESPGAAPPPRGFYCSSSPTNAAAGFCVREKTECERTRDVSIGALADLTSCTLTETAWCFASLCFPTQEACAARRERTGGEECTETK